MTDKTLTIQLDEMPNGKKPEHRLGRSTILTFVNYTYLHQMEDVSEKNCYVC